MIKSTCIAAAVSVSFAVSASAGGMIEPIMEPVMVVHPWHNYRGRHCQLTP